MRAVSRVGFEDTQDSCYPRLEDGPLPEHVGFQIEIPHWVEPRYKRTQYDNIRDTLGEKCHQQPQHHKDIYVRLIHDKIIHGNLGENSPSHPRHTGTDDGDTQDPRYLRLEDKLLPKHVGFNIEISCWSEPRHSNSQLDTKFRSLTKLQMTAYIIS